MDLKYFFISTFISIISLQTSFVHCGIIGSLKALKFQNLFALKQALIASLLPVGNQFVLLPGLNLSQTTPRPLTTVAPLVSLPTTLRPLVPGAVLTTVLPTTARPTVPGAPTPLPTAIPTTARPVASVPASTIIGINQYFPAGSGQYGVHLPGYPAGSGIGQVPVPYPAAPPNFAPYPQQQAPGIVHQLPMQQPGGIAYPGGVQAGAGAYPNIVFPQQNPMIPQGYEYLLGQAPQGQFYPQPGAAPPVSVG